MATWTDETEKSRWELSFKSQFNHILNKFKVSRAQIANASRIDPSYATLFSSKGRLPTRKVMCSLAKGLDILNVPTKEIFALWLSAGLLPKAVKEDLIEDLSVALSLEEGEYSKADIDDIEDDVPFTVDDED